MVEETPKKRLFTETIASDKQPAKLRIPQREGEHPIEAGDHLKAIFLVKVRQNFRIRSAYKRVALLFQLLAKLAIIIDLAVENTLNTFVFSERGLLAGD